MDASLRECCKIRAGLKHVMSGRVPETQVYHEVVSELISMPRIAAILEVVGHWEIVIWIRCLLLISFNF